MKMVRAIRPGVYGARRDVGSPPFAVPDDWKASWAVDVDDPREAEAKEPGYLDGTIEEIKAGIAGLSDTELFTYRDAETAGKTRKGVLALLNDEITNRGQKSPAGGGGKAATDPDPLDDLKTHADVDAVALAENVTFETGVTTVEAKKAAIRTAREDKELLS